MRDILIQALDSSERYGGTTGGNGWTVPAAASHAGLLEAGVGIQGQPKASKTKAD